ncbi:hypothetical protein KIN20_020780 [Parelaphostrongylus tenuis]|uniref:Uncharacterized protein n=1 Tax=Parelaphostrongylus tenuis TaxID=148309 RepID=A0AAD5N4H5_PARTN|nr:hypothetical protein KIN20_020780 [Parelaphostrongylus tenuis]
MGGSAPVGCIYATALYVEPLCERAMDYLWREIKEWWRSSEFQSLEAREHCQLPDMCLSAVVVYP